MRGEVSQGFRTNFFQRGDERISSAIPPDEIISLIFVSPRQAIHQETRNIAEWYVKQRKAHRV
jgi:hypothetical protein